MSPARCSTSTPTPWRRRIGAALGAEKLILCTGAPGILGDVNDPRSLISYTDVTGLKRLREEGRIADGMLPKAKAIEDALRGGVRRVHVVSYQLPGRHPRRRCSPTKAPAPSSSPTCNALTPAEQQGASMSRLWDKGAPAG